MKLKLKPPHKRHVKLPKKRGAALALQKIGYGPLLTATAFQAIAREAMAENYGGDHEPGCQYDRGKCRCVFPPDAAEDCAPVELPVIKSPSRRYERPRS